MFFIVTYIYYYYYYHKVMISSYRILFGTYIIRNVLLYTELYYLNFYSYLKNTLLIGN